LEQLLSSPELASWSVGKEDLDDSINAMFYEEIDVIGWWWTSAAEFYRSFN
jgi:hypothetical protein